MSDDEDNQTLIDEIRALEVALEQKKTSTSNVASTSSISKSELLPKFIAKTEREENLYENCRDEEDDFVADDSYDCRDLQDLLEFNKKLIESIVETRDKMVILLEQCKKKQSLIENDITNKYNNTCSKIVTFNAGMPYFKDKNYFTAPRNEDTETKINRGELCMTQLQRIHRWSQIDKIHLLTAIRHEVTLTLLNKNENTDNIGSTIGSITKSSQLSYDMKKAIGSLGAMKFDWLKIASNIPDNKHSAQECEVMWNIFLHPDINKQKWTPKEDKNLNRIVEEHECEDWDSIAKELNTKRSGYQCFVRYNTNNWKNLMKGQSWTPSDDETLTNLVEKLKIGDYIPWGYIASCMNNWTKQQVYFRWNYSLAPHLKKGRFSEEEDKILLDAVKTHGLNFGKISALVMTHRTNVQLKEHYQTIKLREKQSKKVWTMEEDAKLIELKKKYGTNWVKIVKEMPNPNVTRIQARQRHSALVRFEERGITIDKINRNLNLDNQLSTHTTVIYTNNTPWSRECKEIHVKHLKIDDQLINFFKRESKLKKLEQKGKAYSPDKLKEDTKKLYNRLLNFKANLNIPECIDDSADLNESHLQLIIALHEFTEAKKRNTDEEIERFREDMFGPLNSGSKTNRFIPPLPFGFRIPRFKTKITDTINSNFNTNEYHQVDLPETLEPDKLVTECLNEDTENQFEKLKNLMTSSCKEMSFDKNYLRCKPFAHSSFFEEIQEINNQQHNVLRNSVNKQQMKYDWELNRIISNNLPREESFIENVPVQTIEPNRTTLQGYQEILLTSDTFPATAGETIANNKLTLRGQQALNLFKMRYQQLFHMPAGLSRIIPPDIVDESAFLPVLEKLKKKSLKRKRLTNCQDL